MSSTNVLTERDMRKRLATRKKLNKFIQSTISSFPFRTQSFQELWKQHAATSPSNRLDSLSATKMDRCHRRSFRLALHTRDKHKVVALVRKGVDINMNLSDIFYDTPLMYAVKHGYLEIVEILLQTPGCNTGATNRNGHTIMDEAVHVFLVVENSCSKQVVASRYRIIKCLLRHNVGKLSLSFMDILLFSCIHTSNGRRKVKRLTKLASESQCYCFKDALLCLLIPYKGMLEQVKQLIYHEASLNTYILSHTYLTPLPPQNVSILIKYGTNSPDILLHLAYYIAEMKILSKAVSSNEWMHYEEVFRLLILCGQELPLAVMTFLHGHKIAFYRWVVNYRNKPKPLLDLSRIAIRRSMVNPLSNVLSVQYLPKPIQKILLLDE